MIGIPTCACKNTYYYDTGTEVCKSCANEKCDTCSDSTTNCGN